VARSGNRQFFAERAEVIDWLAALREVRPFWIVAVPIGYVHPVVVLEPTEPIAAVLAGAWRIFFAYQPPPEGTTGKTMNHLGLTDAFVTLDLPEETETELRMGVLAFQSMNPLAQKMFSTTKRAFGSHLTNGVWGVLGEETAKLSRQLAFSPGAVSALRRGKTWRQWGGGLLHFEPEIKTPRDPH